MFFSISHWGMFKIEYDRYQSYWHFVWWANSDARGTGC